MFKALRNIVALLSLLSTALIAYTELRKAWLSLKTEQDAGRTTFRTSEYATGETGAASGFSG